MMREGQDRAVALALYTITVLYMGLIFYLSSLSSIPQPGPLDKIPEVDKLEHASEYLGLGLLLVLSFQQTPSRMVRSNSWPLALLIAVLYAFSDEAHQMFVSGRTSDLLDVLADTAGVTVACLLGTWFHETRASRTKRITAPSVVLTKGMTDSEE
jgi:VanZ family protein